MRTVAVCGLLATLVCAQGRHELWPTGAPGALGDAKKDRPFVTVHAARGDGAAQPAVVVCPGGGYKHLSAIGIYKKLLNDNGITVVHLRYRLPTDGYKHPAPLQDALRAVRMTRAHAKAWKIDPKRVGVLGFSSGGHVASTVATWFDHLPPRSHRDGITKQSGRPDFVVLFCPVVTMLEHAHRPSVVRLLGKDAPQRLKRALSNELKVTPKTPPVFLAHAKDDRLVKPENSIQLDAALRKREVPSTLHLYENGGHGFMSKSEEWKAHLLAWLKALKITS